MKNFILFCLFTTSLLATDPVFIGPYSNIKDRIDEADRKKAEINRNMIILVRLSMKNVLLENEISSMLEDLAKAPDFDMEALSVKTSSTQTDVARSQSMQDGYDAINTELKKTWKTAQ